MQGDGEEKIEHCNRKEKHRKVGGEEDICQACAEEAAGSQGEEKMKGRDRGRKEQAKEEVGGEDRARHGEQTNKNPGKREM